MSLQNPKKIDFHGCEGGPKPSLPAQIPNSSREKLDIPSSSGKFGTSSGLAIWPILLSTLPPTLSFFFGMDDFWSDTILLLLTFYYMYNLIQIPWDLYQASRQRRVANPIDGLTIRGDEPGAAAVEALRYEAQVKLRRQELLAFFMVLVSPLLGGWLFIQARSRLQELNTFISDFNILLFILSAELRPLLHLGHLLKGRAQKLQERVHHPTTAVEAIGRRLTLLENEIQQLKSVYISKQGVGQVHESLEPKFQKIIQLVLRHQQRDRLESSRFDSLIQELRCELNELKPDQLNSNSSIRQDQSSYQHESGVLPGSDSCFMRNSGERFPFFSIFTPTQGISTLAIQFVLTPITLLLSILGSVAQCFLPSRPENHC